MKIGGDLYSQIPSMYYWRVIPSPVTSNLNSYTYPGIIAGDNGALLYTTNSGFSYQQFAGIPNYNFYSVSTIWNLTRYTAVGQNGIIYYGTGFNPTTWAQQTSGTNANLYSAGGALSNSQFIFWRSAVGTGGIILRSTSSTASNWSAWNTVPSGTTQDLYSVFSYTNYGWIAGNNGTILKTTDCGGTWTAINSGVTNKLNFIGFINENTGFVTGSNGLIMKSTNGGLNWFLIPSNTTADLKSFTPYYICGSGGTALQSTDDGATWTPALTGTTNNLNSVSWNSGIYAYTTPPFLIGNTGTILRRDIDSSFLFKTLDGNNIRSVFCNSGVFDNNRYREANSPDFEWPKNSNKYAIYYAGFSTGALVQGQLRQASASYRGEYTPGYCVNGSAVTNDTFKIYSVKRGDGPANNLDWNNWGLMVPYGAPFIDVNNNGTYEPMIDTPGVKNASQTIFACLTDGFQSSHTVAEGFGGGTLPLFAEVHLTAWTYSQPTYTDMQFMKYVVINKGLQTWTRTYFSIVSDPDLGSWDDDYVGCDTTRELAYCYNADNNDPVYGENPPAVGFLLLKGPYSKYSAPPRAIDMTSFTYFFNNSSSPSMCEAEANGEPYPSYLTMQGYKKDSTFFLDPGQSPPKRTKHIFAGDPETNTGWTEYKGVILNCNHDTTGTFIPVNYPGDRRFVMGFGADYLTVNPGDTQTIVLSQLIARGNSNKNSVTKLKLLSDLAREFYNTNFTIGVKQVNSEVPSSFSLRQNYPNPFNPTTTIRFQLSVAGNASLKIFDMLGKEVATLVNDKLNAGTYTVVWDGTRFASGVYFYRLTSDAFSETRKMLLIR